MYAKLCQIYASARSNVDISNLCQTIVHKSEHSKWNVENVEDTGPGTGMRFMFENAKKFKADIGATWSGDAATTQEKDIFLGADAFNELYECETPANGPVSSCEKVRPPSPWRCD